MAKLLQLTAALGLALAAPATAAPNPVKSPAASPRAAVADPQKLALAAKVSAALWPDGTYGRMFQSMMGGENGLFDMALDMRPEDLLGGNAPESKAPEAKAKPSPTLREMMSAEDPNFEERMRITARVVGEEMTRIATPIEPKMRNGLTQSIARRFTSEQLGPIADFFATAPGRAYAAQSLSLFIDKDVLLAMISSAPAVVKEVPGIMDKVQKATAHLPKPKSKVPEVTGDTDDNGKSDEGNDSDVPST